MTLRPLLFFALAACGAGKHEARVIAPPVVASTRPVASVETPAPPRDCWTGEGAVLTTIDDTADRIAPPKSTTAYPLHYALIDAAEIKRRQDALHRRHPEIDFFVDDLGVVTDVTTRRMPCDVRDEIDTSRQLTMKTEESVKRYLEALGRALPDVPFIAGYGVKAVLVSDVMKLALSTPTYVPYVPAVLTSDLPKTELDDATLAGKWSGARVQLFQMVERVHKRDPDPSCRDECLPPPTHFVTKERKLVGERPFSMRYFDALERTNVITRTATGAEVRRVARLRFNGKAVADDVLPKNTLHEGVFDVDVTGTDRRDAITGDAIPRPH